MGGGGGSDYGAQAAEQDAKKQKAREALNLQFGVGEAPEAAANRAAREALYTKVRGDAFTAGSRSLDENRDKSARELKFALFGQGLNGGSEDVNQNAMLGRVYNEGKLNLGAKADAAAADLRGSDEQTRLALLQSIDAGMDQSSALSSALNSMRVNSDKSAAAAAGTSLGNLFDDAGLLYSRSKAGQGAIDARSQFSALFPGLSSGRRGNATGMISSVGG